MLHLERKNPPYLRQMVALIRIFMIWLCISLLGLNTCGGAFCGSSRQVPGGQQEAFAENRDNAFALVDSLPVQDVQRGQILLQVVPHVVHLVRSEGSSSATTVDCQEKVMTHVYFKLFCNDYVGSHAEC